MNDKKLIIIIPVYNKIPKKTEIASLKQFAKIYNWEYDVRLIHPNSFSYDDVKQYINILNAPEDVYLQFKDYDCKYFESQYSYSQLLKSNSFYNDYKDYDYMLIMQTDVWVLDLEKIGKWVDMNFDYVGAPIISNKRDWPSAPCCGNGGLSLRKIKSFIKYTSDEELVNKLNENPTYEKYEDVFFCQGISQHMCIDMPIWEECSNFAWDMNPDILWKIKLRTLPDIGIHAWPKNIPFWKTIIKFDDSVISEALNDNEEFIKIYYKNNTF